jgi:hypothetical protein
MDWIGIGVVVVLGAAVILYGWLWDRTTNQRRTQALESPPDRPIPGLRPDAAAPAYVLAKDLTAHTDPDTTALAGLQPRLDSATPLPFGHGRGAFANLGPRLAVLANPAIVIVDGEITSMRELLSAVEQARAAARPLVVVATRIADEVYHTLEANALAKTLPCAAVTIQAATDRRTFAERVGASMVMPADMKMGWLPADSVGSCVTWVSSADSVWLLDDEPPPAESSTDAGDDFPAQLNTSPEAQA